MFGNQRKNIFFILVFLGIMWGMLSGCSSSTHRADGDTSETTSEENISEPNVGSSIPAVTPTPTPTSIPTQTCTATPTPTCTPIPTSSPAPSTNPHSTPPLAKDDNVRISENENVLIDVLDNDIDSDGSLLMETIYIVTLPQHGSVEIKNGKILYFSNANYTGTDTFTYTVKDNDGMVSNSATVSIIIQSTNHMPIAQFQSLTTSEDTNLSITLNGSDEDNDTLTYRLISQPSHGTLKGIAPNLIYVPNANYHGMDSFDFMVTDGKVDSNIAKIDITVIPTNDAPVAIDDSVSTEEDTEIVIDILSNDSDMDGTLDPSSLTIHTGATHGTISIVNGKINYEPQINYYGTDTFTYTVKDNEGSLSNEARVTITIGAKNDTPLAQPQSISTPEDTNLSIMLSGSDEDNDTLIYKLISQPSHGTLKGIAPNLIYVPNANYHGMDSFDFMVNDVKVDSNIARIDITIIPTNDAPVADDKSLVTPEDTPVNVVLSGGDIDGDNLTYSITVQAQYGTVSGTLPHLTYTPALGFYGRDSFQYIVNDGQVDSQEALVSIDVVRNNVAPIAIDQNVTTDEDVAVAMTLLGVDSDTQDILTYHVVSQPLHGTLSGMENNLTYTPDANYSGVDSFTFRVNDGLVDSNVATVGININTKAEESCTDTSVSVGQFNPVVKFEWDWNHASYPNYKQVMSSPIIGQINDDNSDGKINNQDTPDIIFTTFSGYNYQSDGVLRVISGHDGNEILAIPHISPYHAPAIGDIDNDGLVEIIIGTNAYGGLNVFENDGTLKWSVNTSHSGEIALADLDNDGNSEIIYGDAVYDKDGQKLWNFDASTIPLVANINDDSQLELISNGKAYDAQGNILWDSGHKGDYGAIGNFDNDKYPEIALTRNGQIFLLENDGTLKWGPVAIPGGGGGAITVSDLDADGEPELSIAGANYYVVFETDGSVKWKQIIQDYSSRITGSTVFDFEGDGKVEILYNDELYFRIYDGETGAVLFDMNNTSGTLWEYPIVADIDNDGHAEIILATNNYTFQEPDRVGGVTGIRVLEDANNTWAPTRSIWNQHSYHISNINDDGTIPRYEEPSWLTHNTYRLNTFAVNTRCQKPPRAYTNEYSTLESTAKSIALLAKDINEDTLTYRIVTPSLHGTLTGTAPYLTYIPNDNYVGDDSFSYVANDGRVDSNEANITIHILSSANALVAVDDDVVTGEDTNVTIDVLANDSNGTSYISMAVVVQATHGDALVQNGQILYVPKPNYHGEDSFYYTYRNADGFVSNSAKVTVLIGASNDAPIAESKSLSIDEDTQIILTLQATDADNDTLTYSIVSAPKHGTINGVAPYVSYTPNANDVGVDSFTFMANDGNLNSNEANISIEIKAINDAPVAIAGQGQQNLLGTTVTLDAYASYDVDGNIVSYVWKEGSTILSTEQTFSKSDFSLGKHTLLLEVTDNNGARGQSTTNIIVVSKDTPDTNAPIITVLGDNPYKLNINGAYSDAGATAYDDRDGNISVGVQYSFDASVKGTYYVTYTATDSAGNSATATRTVMVIDNSTPDDTPPVITLLGDNPQITYLGSTFIDAGVRVTDDHDGNIGYSLVHNVNTNQLGTYLVTYTATDSAGNSAEANRSVRVRDPNGNRVPLANAGNDVTVSLGSEVTLDATQSTDADGVIVSYLWKEGNVTLSNSATFTKSDFTLGKHAITLIVTDNEGATSSDTVIIRVTDPSDTTPPVALITSPAENAKITLQTEVIGTASDDNFDSYTLAISPVGKERYTRIVSGTDSVVNGTLGTIDATTLKNGIYDVKLTVSDQNGATSEAYTKVIIDGKAKIGNFSFTVTDFDIKVGGIPVQVNRTYSTLQRYEKLDFTYAWSIDYQNVKLEESIHPGKAWKTTPDVLIGSCFKTDKQHIVNVSLPDGTTESFEFKFARECGHYFVGSFYDAPILKPLNGTTAKLETIDASDSVMMNNAGEIIDGSSLQPYNPSAYRLTLANGMVYEISENDGIQKVKDIRGDTLTYTHDGIQSSRGESLTFERDAQDHITKITDLGGRTVNYHYNQNDDLDYVVDQMGQKTEYRYQAGHLLEEYFDPSGLRLAKNIYDASGRLIKTIDADGNVVEFTHNIDGKEEVLKDKLGRTSVFVYDDAGNVLSQTNPLGETTTRTYDEKGRELTVTDPLGNTITNTYDTKGNLLSTVDALGNTETTTYNDKQSPTSISDKNGNTMQIVYNDYNNPRYITTASGAKSTYWYDKFGNKVESINEYNQTTKFKYDGHFVTLLGIVSSKGNVEKETRPYGTVIDHTYDDNSNLLSTTTTLADGTSTTTSSTYDAFDRVVSSTDELGQTTGYAYDARGNKVSTTDSQGRATKYTYNNHNKITLTTYPDGSTESKTYDAMDNLLSQTNQEGETTSYAYDGADRLTKTTYTDGTTMTSTYDAAGRTTSTTDQNSNTTIYTYDAVGNKLSQTDALGNTTTFSYDANGNTLTITDAKGNTIAYAYDAQNNRIRTTFADGSTLVNTYDISGNKTSSTNQKGISTQYGYDIYNRLVSVKDTLGNETTFSYDATGNKLSQTDALGRVTSWEYDKYGREVSRTLPLGQKQTTSYDAQGRVASKTDFNGAVTSYTYDINNRVVKIDYADGGSDSYSYDALGRNKSTSITDAQGKTQTTSYEYDSMGRLSKEVQPSGASLVYRYDNAGNLLVLTLTNAQGDESSTKYSYDTLNRLSTVTSDTGDVTHYSYDAVGNQSTVTYANGNTAHYSYDAPNRLTSLVHKNAQDDTLASFLYTLSLTGERTQIKELHKTSTYTYDDLGRLLSEEISDATHGDYTASYSYDAVGNRVQSIIDGVTTQYSYDDNDRLTQQGGTSYTYDDNGNTLTQTLDANTTSYSYNAKNELVQRSDDAHTVSYTYNSDSIRTSKTVDGVSTSYVVDENQAYAQVLQEQEDNHVTVSYTYGSDLISQTRQNNKTTTYHYDGLGSARYLSDETGTFTDSYDYEAFGKLLQQEGNTSNSYRYTGEQQDKESKQYYLRARYYAPTTGRFTQMDSYQGSQADPVSLHKYLYANTNPVSYTDPAGHFSMMDTAAAMSIANTLRKGQIEGYTKGMEIVMGLLNGVKYDSVTDLAKIPALAGTSLGLRLMMRFSPKLQKACKNSFDGQTLVATENGLVSIEEIHIGDKVWAYNEHNQTKSLQEVTHLIRGEGSKELTDITLDSGEVITATNNHPIWEQNSQNWTDAGKLKLDSILLSRYDNNISIVDLRQYTQQATVYNLTVANDHTYFVGVSGVLGHNVGCRLPDENLWRHIFEGDYVGRKLTGVHHAVMGMAPRGLRITHVIPRQEKVGFYNALVYRINGNGAISRPKKGKYSTMFPDEWSREYVQEIVNKGFYKAISKGGGGATGINVPVSDILGNRYNGVLLKYRFNPDGSVASVYPILQ